MFRKEAALSEEESRKVAEQRLHYRLTKKVETEYFQLTIYCIKISYDRIQALVGSGNTELWDLISSVNDSVNEAKKKFIANPVKGTAEWDSFTKSILKSNKGMETLDKAIIKICSNLTRRDDLTLGICEEISKLKHEKDVFITSFGYPCVQVLKPVGNDGTGKSSIF